MADQKITDFPALVAPASGDLVPLVHTPATIPTNEKVTIDSLGILGGWVNIPETLTFGSVDGHTFTATTPGDVTAKYTPGMRFKITQATGGTKYFIITAISFSTPNTTFTLYGGTDYTLNNEAINTPAYSMAKAPLGFPLNPDKWTEILKDTSDRTQNPPVNGTWYNLGSLSLAIPIGSWKVSYSAVCQGNISSNETVLSTTLSTVNNSETDRDFTSLAEGFGSSAFNFTAQKEKALTLSVKTPYFLNARESANVTILSFTGASYIPTIIKAVSAYL